MAACIGTATLPRAQTDAWPWVAHRFDAWDTRLRSTGHMPNGTVKWFNTTKGYGFIAPEDGGKDVFVHISAVERSGLTGLADDQKVSFELKEGRDGRMMASDIKIL
jgi:CspA family cold shock protein